MRFNTLKMVRILVVLCFFLVGFFVLLLVKINPEQVVVINGKYLQRDGTTFFEFYYIDKENLLKEIDEEITMKNQKGNKYEGKIIEREIINYNLNEGEISKFLILLDNPLEDFNQEEVYSYSIEMKEGKNLLWHIFNVNGL